MGVGFVDAGTGAALRAAGAGVGVGAGFDHGQRISFDGEVGLAFEAPEANGGANMRPKKESVTENFMNGSNRRDRDAAQSPGWATG